MALHPVVAEMLEKQRNAGVPGLSDGTPEEARALVAAGRAALGNGPPMAESRLVDVPTRDGGLAARLLVPSGRVRGLIVYLHGGGWVVGTPDDYDTLGRTLALRSSCAVLLPDYRLAPEHRYPAGLRDAEDVLTWAAAGAGGHLDAELPLIVAGDSAGANLATVAARLTHGRVSPVLQVLVYPVVDCDFDTSSYREHGEGLPLTRKDMEWFFDQYAPPGVERRSADISPLRSDALAGLPPALVLTADNDVLRSEGEAYAGRLAAAGVPVISHCYPGMAHGFLRLHALLATADDALDAVAAAVREAVAPHGSSPSDR